MVGTGIEVEDMSSHSREFGLGTGMHGSESHTVPEEDMIADCEEGKTAGMVEQGGHSTADYMGWNMSSQHRD